MGDCGLANVVLLRRSEGGSRCVDECCPSY